jgi:hypothetical protein
MITFPIVVPVRHNAGAWEKLKPTGECVEKAYLRSNIGANPSFLLRAFMFWTCLLETVLRFASAILEF